MKTTFASICLAISLAATPLTAFAISASSNDGSATHRVVRWFEGGANMSGRVKSTSGSPVYLGGMSVYNRRLDEHHGRYTTDTRSRTWVLRSGRIGVAGNVGIRMDGVKFRVCRNRSYMPDPCGSWSRTIRK